MDEIFKDLEVSGKKMKTLLSEAQITLGMMETYFMLIQREILKFKESVDPTQEGK